MSAPPRDGVLRDAAVVLGCFVAAGLLAGVLWPLMVDPAVVVRTENGLTTSEVALGERFDNDAWFMLLGAALALPLGMILTVWRRTDQLVTTMAIVVGASAASWLASVLGRALGPDDPALVLADAEVGSTAEGMVRVTAEGAYLVWPAAALVGVLLVLWGSAAPHPHAAPHEH